MTYAGEVPTIDAPVPPRKTKDAAAPTPFGLRLKQAREARNMSMRELAEAARTTDDSLSHTTISLIESGRQHAIDVTVAVRIARVLGVTVEWWVTGEGAGPTQS